MLSLQIILAVVLACAVTYFGWQLYHRSVRLRNRAQLSSIFTNITHELLTPLTVISASVERLRDKEPQYDNDYDLMQLNIERMVRLLQQILETSKSQSGELKLLVAHGDVMQYIQRTALCIEPLMAKRGLHFTIDCHPESMMGWIDTDKLDKIIYNLLSNAAKYTDIGGCVKLEARTNKTYDHVIITVSDNGIGIAKDKMKNLFRRYYDGEYRRLNAIGTGLGLALTRELVFLHGGNITCDSEEGKGTVFTVTLPINKEAFSKDQIDENHLVNVDVAPNAILDLALRMKIPAEMPEQITGDEACDDNAYKLLVVEDNLDLLMLMNLLLSQKYQVKTAKNGEEAMEIIQNNEIDLVVSDVMMPVMDGYELTRHLKSDPNYKHLPVILLTAKTQEEDRTVGLLAGADSYLTKPFKVSDLELQIDNIIENRRRIQAEFQAQSAEETMEQAVARGPSPDELFMKRALDCVYAHLSDADYDREAFAADMGASASSLYNKLRAQTGMSVSAFIRSIRMKEAQRIIRQQPWIRVNELAYQVGYSDPKYFSTCFKKDFGMLPSEYIDGLSKNETKES